MSWKRFFRREQRDFDHAQEFQSHLELQVDDNIARGMTPAEARNAANRKFGNPAQRREEVYEENSVLLFETLRRDLRYAARMLARSPGFTVTAVVCLTLGIGASTAIFSVVNSVLLRPLPYSHPESLLRLYTTSKPHFAKHAPAVNNFWFSPPEFLDLKTGVGSFSSLDAWVSAGANLAGGNEPVRVTASYVTGGLLQSLGVGPERGRLLEPADDQPDAPQTAVISHGLWQRVFGGDAATIGSVVTLNGRKVSVVGIMPPEFQFPPGESDSPDVWTALRLDPANPGSRTSHYLYGLARLKRGVTVQSARAELGALVASFGARQSPAGHELNPEGHATVLVPFQDDVIGNVRPALLVLLGSVGFVLLISSVNVANLLLARAEARQRETSVRKALGASTGALVRQFITEGLVLSLVGAALGLAVSFAGVHLITVTNAGSLPRASEIGVNWAVLRFTVLLAIGTGIAFGLAPLAQLRGCNANGALKAASTRSTAGLAANRLRRCLVVGELALALTLLIGTGLMIKTFWKLRQVDIGINAPNLLTMSVSLPQAIYPEPRAVLQFWTNLQQRVSALPGVESASMMSGLPPVRRVDSNTTMVEGYRSDAGMPLLEIQYYQAAGDRYFETMGIRLIDGRFFDQRDGETAPPTAIINQTLARTIFPNESALGHRLRPGGSEVLHTIVGIVADVKNGGVDKPTGTELYLPYRQTNGPILRAANLAVRAGAHPEALISAIRGEIHSLDPSMPVANVRTMDQVLESVEARPRFLATILTLFASAALVLAAVGIYGVISYSVAQRTGEFGIRMALGARSSDLLRMVLSQGATLGLAGLALGALGAFMLTRFLRDVLFGVSALDPWTFAGMVILLGTVTLLASYVPARRATKVDPTAALKYE